MAKFRCGLRFNEGLEIWLYNTGKFFKSDNRQILLLLRNMRIVDRG